MAWEEVEDRCFRQKYDGFEVNVGVILGSRGAVLVDTRASVPEGLELREQLRELGVSRPVAIVNTHGHFDHCFGNAAFDGPFWGHPDLPEYLEHEAWRTLDEDDPDWAARVRGTPVTAPTRLVRDVALIDLGDRIVELHHLGRGHTGHDLVVRVPDRGLVFAGDLVEESGPPSYGSDGFPLDWPITLTRLLELDPRQIVPGHGDPVGPRFAEDQRDAVGAVAHGIRETYDAGLDTVDALNSRSWPYDPALLLQAVLRGHRQLAASG